MVALVATLLLGFALRVVELDHRPLWWDEGNNAFFAHQSLFGLVRESRATQDTDPPVHRLLLGLWKELVGSSPFSMRMLSALAGVVTIPLTWAVGRWLMGKQVALLAQLLVALAPMQVYYGREAKGYTLAAALALLCTYTWGRKLGYVDPGLELPSDASPWWIVYVLSSAMGLGTHYYLAPLFLWQGLWTAGSLGVAAIGRTSDWTAAHRALGRWLLAAGMIALLLAPWVAFQFVSTARGVRGLSDANSSTVPIYLQKMGLAMSAGPDQTGPHALLATFVLLVLGIVGALTTSRGVFLAA
ncbi:MAG: glycosyltransferase family 39 protein [Anaerolineae bacterium]